MISPLDCNIGTKLVSIPRTVQAVSSIAIAIQRNVLVFTDLYPLLKFNYFAFYPVPSASRLGGVSMPGPKPSSR